MSGDLPRDPFAEEDGDVDPLADGERLHDALAHIAVLGNLAQFAAAIGALDEAQAKRALIGSLVRLARDVQETSERRRGGRTLRRTVAAALRAGKREWSR